MDADLAILHVDVTVVPDEYIQFMRQYPVAINRPTVKDISKRHISAEPGPSRRRLRGAGHRQDQSQFRRRPGSGNLRSSRHGLPNTPGRFAAGCRGACAAELDVWEYPIFDSVGQVPSGRLAQPGPIVELIPSRTPRRVLLHEIVVFPRRCRGEQADVRQPADHQIESRRAD